MNFPEELRAYLVAANTAAGSRVYPIKRDSTAALPAITYQQIAGPRIRSHGGDSNLKYPTYQITTYALTYDAAKELAKEVIIVLESVRGTWGTISINASFVEGELDAINPNEGEKLVVLDIIVWYKE